MTFSKSSTKKITLLSLLLFMLILGYSQKTSTRDLVSVKAYIVGKGSPAFNKDDDQNFFSVATVTNIQDTIISFWIMNESWAVENWITDNDSIYLKFLGNDLNSPT